MRRKKTFLVVKRPLWFDVHWPIHKDFPSFIHTYQKNGFNFSSSFGNISNIIDDLIILNKEVYKCIHQKKHRLLHKLHHLDPKMVCFLIQDWKVNINKLRKSIKRFQFEENLFWFQKSIKWIFLSMVLQLLGEKEQI